MLTVQYDTLSLDMHHVNKQETLFEPVFSISGPQPKELPLSIELIIYRFIIYIV